MVGAFLLTWGGVVSHYIVNLQESIHFSQKEWKGIQYQKPLLRLFHNLHEYHILKNSKESKGKAEQALSSLLRSIDSLDEIFSDSVSSEKEKWKKIKHNIFIEGRREKGVSSDCFLVKFSIFELMGSIAQRYYLDLDPRIESHMFLHANVELIPRLIKNIGEEQTFLEQFLVSEKKITKDEKTRSLYTLGAIKNIEKKLWRAYERIIDYASQNHTELRWLIQNAQRNLQSFEDHVAPIIEKKDVPVTKLELFDVSAKAVDSVLFLYSYNHDALMDILHERIKSARAMQGFVIFFSFLLIIGVIVLFVAFKRTYGERKKAEVSLIEAKQNLEDKVQERTRDLKKYGEVIEFSNDAILIATPSFDRQGPKIIFVNNAFEDITGHKRKSIIGKTLFSFHKLNTNFKKYKNEFTDQKIFEHKIVHYTKNNRNFWLSINVFPILDDTGKMINIAAIARDITKQKKEESTLRVYSEKLKLQKKELRKAKQNAEKANQMKSDFLANVSHELRTPLNSILGMSRLLISTDIDTEQRELLLTVLQSSVNLLNIVNNILDLSKIEAGEVRLESIGFDIAAVIQKTTHSLEQLAIDKKLQYIEEFSAAPHPYVLGDPTCLCRILNNLIGNAIKYTQKGIVSVKVDFKYLDKNSLHFICEISDTGIGIPDKKLESIFDKFTQADASITRKFGGTGLGLAITKQLVELMGGNISVQSKVGSGSVFTIVLPFKITDQVHADMYSQRKHLRSGFIKPEDVRILVAEDHPLNQIFIQKLLRKFGVRHITVAHNGLEALKKYDQEIYDVILMDCHMPEKNGYEATQAIRNSEKNIEKSVAIVAVTADAMESDREKCLRCGMDDYISKPIDEDELKCILSQWIMFPEKDDFQVRKKDHASRDHYPLLDLTSLRTFSEGNKEEEKRFVSVFLESALQNLEMLRATCVDGKNEEWVEAAHKLKGAAAGVGAGELAGVCANAQNCIDGKKEEREMLFDTIVQSFNEVESYLKQEGLCS